MYCTKRITDDMVWVGADDRRLALFEGVYGVPDGVSYNSYLILDEKTILFDTVDKAVAHNFFDNVAHELAGRKLDYLVISHMEPDHAATIEDIALRYPEAKIVCNAKIRDMLARFFPTDLSERLHLVKEGDSLSTGRHEFTFVMAPMVHWPEVMMTYDKTDKILFSADAFGSFGALNGRIFADECDFMNEYLDEARRYYTNIVGKYGMQVTNVIKKLANIEIKYICPSHGLLWRDDIPKVISLYESWAKFEPQAEGVVIVYGSMYGNTAKMAEILGRKLNCCGIKEVKIYDASKTDHTYIISEIWKYKGLMIGSCAHNNSIYPKVEPLLHKLENYGLKNRYLGIFGTMMWSGGGVRGIQAFADKLNGIEVVGDAVEVKGTPKAEDIARLEVIAEEMAAKLIAERL